MPTSSPAVAARCQHHHHAGGAQLLPLLGKNGDAQAVRSALAFKIEHSLTKDQILELYVNQIYLGQRAYGFAAAAQISSANRSSS